MNITLITDSTCDISPEILKAKGVRFAPLKVLFQDGEYVDKYDLTNPEFYEKMKNSEVLPTTSQVNPNEFHELFVEELQKGNKIIGVFLSAELSGTYQSASIAKDMIGSDEIYLIDSKTTSFGLGLIVNKLLEYLHQDLEINEIIERISEKINNTLI
jgi:DegV family protein with EDD domain